MEDNSMEQMKGRNKVDEMIIWKDSPEAEKQDMESEEECETLFIVEEIEAI
jgi:hypothetical protein